MLQALIRVANDSTGTKRQGDVICVKLYEQAVWGSEEIKFHQAVPWIDNDLELTMRQHHSDFPVFTTPYIVRETVLCEGPEGTESSIDVCKTRSSKYFDINEIEDEYLKQKIISNSDVVSADELQVEIIDKCIKDKTESQINTEFEFNKINAIKNISDRVILS
tara:strand:+ start:1566 stop:2054 length:489 start_codon:yes stop_codon:yes gene_type:complete